MTRLEKYGSMLFACEAEDMEETLQFKMECFEEDAEFPAEVEFSDVYAAIAAESKTTDELWLVFLTFLYEMIGDSDLLSDVYCIDDEDIVTFSYEGRTLFEGNSEELRSFVGKVKDGEVK